MDTGLEGRVRPVGCSGIQLFKSGHLIDQHKSIYVARSMVGHFAQVVLNETASFIVPLAFWEHFGIP